MGRIHFAVFLFILAGPLLAQPEDYPVHVISQPQRSVEETQAAASEIAPVRYQPPANRWHNLERTRTELHRPNGKLRIVMLGDSIMNDTARSNWAEQLKTRYPNCQIEMITVVRAGSGCQWFQLDNRVQQHVLPQEPDLLLIGGISHGGNVDAIREVIRQVRSARLCDVLLLSEAYGLQDPIADPKWSLEIRNDPPSYRSRLRDLAAEQAVAFLDLTAIWGHYIRESGQPLDWFKRDKFHANLRGGQVLAQILTTHLGPDPAEGR